MSGNVYSPSWKAKRLYVEMLETLLPDMRFYIETLETLLLGMSQLSAEIYKYFEGSEPEDLKVQVNDGAQAEQGTSPQSIEEFMLSRSYSAYTAAHVPSMRKTYLSINSEWFKEYILDELGVVLDCYIAKLLDDYKELNMVCL